VNEKRKRENEMRKLIGLLSVAVFALVSGSAFAQFEWSQALKSKAALKSYLEERSVSAYVGIDGEHVYPGSGNYGYTNVTKAADLRAAVRGIRLKASFDPAYPNFWTRVQYSDVDGNCTLYGVESVSAQKMNGVWVLPNSVILTVPTYTVLPLPDDGRDLWQVYTKIYDSVGNLVGWRNCEIFERNGHRYIQYPSWITGDQLLLSGQTAEVLITSGDGKGDYGTVVINPSTGTLKPVDTVLSTLNPMIEGREYLAPNQNIDVTIPSLDSVGINPIYQLPITKSVTVTVKAKTSEGEVSPRFQYRRLKDDTYPGDKGWSISPTGTKTLTPGVYDIWFDGWPTFHELEDQQLWDYYPSPVQGGSGSGSGGGGKD
jgi:hypothetical protein